MYPLWSRNVILSRENVYFNPFQRYIWHEKKVRSPHYILQITVMGQTYKTALLLSALDSAISDKLVWAVRTVVVWRPLSSLDWVSENEKRKQITKENGYIDPFHRLWYKCGRYIHCLCVRFYRVCICVRELFSCLWYMTIQTLNLFNLGLQLNCV